MQKVLLPTLAGIFLILISGYIFLSCNSVAALGSFCSTSSPATVEYGSSVAPTIIAEPTVTPTQSQVTPTLTPSPTAEVHNIYYPMTRYEERITNRWHGKAIEEKDSEALPCGDPFTGFHVGDDLEVQDSEIGTDIPVYAVADGTVRRVDAVGGYGGLLIIEHVLNDQRVTGYYGHIDLSKTTIGEGDTVQAGQPISVLAPECSPQSSEERKHLHFSIRQGTDIDVRGYIEDESDLTNWLDPRLLLKRLNAKVPQ